MENKGLNPRALARVVDFVETNTGATLTLATLAGVACMSRFHFARMFRASTGATPMRYVRHRRLEKARQQLEGGGAALCDIAVHLGFCDQSHFTRAFRKATGFTPRAYVRQARGATRDALTDIPQEDHQ